MLPLLRKAVLPESMRKLGVARHPADQLLVIREGEGIVRKVSFKR